jgi:gamma-glutamyltranspeptidase
VASADGPVDVVNGSGRAPSGLDVEDLRRRGSSMPVSGALPVTVPGVVSAWEALASGWGSRPLGEALSRAADAAAAGVEVAPGLARDLAAEARLLGQDAGAAALLLPGGVPLRAGQELRQPRLAESLRVLAADGPAALYGGEIGRSIVATLAGLGSAMTLEDLAGHRADVDRPVGAEFAGVEYLTSGANTQGTFFLEGLAALEVLAGRTGRIPDPLGADAGRVARILSAAASSRDRLLGDPAHSKLPVEWLLSEEHAAELATWCIEGGPLPGGAPEARRPSAPAVRRPGDTVAIVAADGQGGWVSLIQSAFHAFGSGVLDPATGILLHNRGASFSLSPGSPNVAAPGRRPLHTLMPVLARVGDELIGGHGTMGGRAQHQIHTQLALHLAAGRDAQAAVSAPRWVIGRMEAGTSQEDADRTVSWEGGIEDAALAALRSHGFRTTELPPQDDGTGHAQLVRRADGGGADLAAATDPRADGAALVGQAPA